MLHSPTDRPACGRRPLRMTAATSTLAAGRTGPRQALVVLCITETISFGVLYYAFPVLAADITADTGWSTTAITSAFSAGLIVAGLTGVYVGRLLDTRGPRVVMASGSALAVVATAGIAAAPTFLLFVLAWLVAGVAMAAVFYQPAFAAITRWFETDRVRALTTLTLVAGLASTIFAPSTAALAGSVGWRGAFGVLAGVLALVTVPLHVYGLRHPWPTGHNPQYINGGDIRGIAATRSFRYLTAAMALGAFVTSAVVVGTVPLLADRGLATQTAAIALGLGGLGQVAGRLGYGALFRHTSARSRAVVIFTAVAASTAVLSVLPATTGLLLTAAIAAGMARGVYTLLQATAVSDRWAAAHYPRLNGILSAPMMITTAIAPACGAAIAVHVGGYRTLFLLLAGTAVLAAVLASLTATEQEI